MQPGHAEVLKLQQLEAKVNRLANKKRSNQKKKKQQRNEHNDGVVAYTKDQRFHI